MGKKILSDLRQNWSMNTIIFIAPIYCGFYFFTFIMKKGRHNHSKLGLINMKYVSIVLFVMTSIVACDVVEEDRFCGTNFFVFDGCACYSTDQGWCFGYHTDTTPPEKGECEADGGIELIDCPAEGLVGTCSENDDFHSPSISLYESYEGSLDLFTNLETAPAECEDDGLYSWSEASN